MNNTASRLTCLPRFPRFRASALMHFLFLTLVSPAATFGDYTYTVADNKATITKYNGSGGAVSIPSTLGGYPVTTIGSSAFNKCDSLTSVTIPGSVSVIEISVQFLRNDASNNS